jgi:hypothetical protein
MGVLTAGLPNFCAAATRVSRLRKNQPETALGLNEVASQKRLRQGL